MDSSQRMAFRIGYQEGLQETDRPGWYETVCQKPEMALDLSAHTAGVFAGIGVRYLQIAAEKIESGSYDKQYLFDGLQAFNALSRTKFLPSDVTTVGIGDAIGRIKNGLIKHRDHRTLSSVEEIFGSAEKKWQRNYSRTFKRGYRQGQSAIYEKLRFGQDGIGDTTYEERGQVARVAIDSLDRAYAAVKDGETYDKKAAMDAMRVLTTEGVLDTAMLSNRAAARLLRIKIRKLNGVLGKEDGSISGYIKSLEDLIRGKRSDAMVE